MTIKNKCKEMKNGTNKVRYINMPIIKFNNSKSKKPNSSFQKLNIQNFEYYLPGKFYL